MLTISHACEVVDVVRGSGLLPLHGLQVAEHFLDRHAADRTLLRAGFLGLPLNGQLTMVIVPHGSGPNSTLHCADPCAASRHSLVEILSHRSTGSSGEPSERSRYGIARPLSSMDAVRRISTHVPDHCCASTPSLTSSSLSV